MRQQKPDHLRLGIFDTPEDDRVPFRVRRVGVGAPSQRAARGREILAPDRRHQRLIRESRTHRLEDLCNLHDHQSQDQK